MKYFFMDITGIIFTCPSIFSSIFYPSFFSKINLPFFFTSVFYSSMSILLQEFLSVHNVSCPIKMNFTHDVVVVSILEIG